MGLRNATKDRVVSGKALAAPKRPQPLLSPLRYPGSKRRLVASIEKIIRSNGLRPALFVEPFSGGASVALQLLENQTVEKIGLVDFDPWVASFWKTVFFDTSWLVHQVETIDVNLKQWHRFKAYKGVDVRKQALACLFLNRTSFSGILANSAGPIGGARQKSEYSIECRFPRDTLIKRIEQAGLYRDRVAFVWNMSWRTAIDRIQRLQKSGRLSRDAFYYVDPPFFEKADRLYRYYFDNEDHAELRDALIGMRAPWLLSYDSPKTARQLYQEATALKRINMNYSGQSEGGFRAAQEILISNLANLTGRPREHAVSALKITSKRYATSDVFNSIASSGRQRQSPNTRGP